MSGQFATYKRVATEKGTGNSRGGCGIHDVFMKRGTTNEEDTTPGKENTPINVLCYN